MVSRSRRFNFILSFKFEYRKSRTIKGTLHLIKSVQLSAQSLHKTSSHFSQDSQLNNSFTFAVLLGAAVPHLERGTATLKWPLEGREYLYFLCPPPTALLLPHSFSSTEQSWCSSSLSSIVASQALKHSSDSTIKSWDKRQQNSSRELIHWFPKSKEHFVHVLADGCVRYSWSLAPSRLERCSVSLPSLWQPWEVCNHLLQLVKSPLISRVFSLNLRTR
jgi:hypothetical protein